jgi:hypothetical protein
VSSVRSAMQAAAGGFIALADELWSDAVRGKDHR